MTALAPKALYQRLRNQTGSRCGYCHTPSQLIGQPLTVEHIIPRACGGSFEESNLWLSCRRCNEYKGTKTDGIDPETGLIFPLFNPRQQVWKEHFAWSKDGTLIIGLTPCGRATVAALQMNNADIVAVRLLWVAVGWHPPQEDE